MQIANKSLKRIPTSSCTQTGIAKSIKCISAFYAVCLKQI